ncbi:MAG: hypothetical protein AABX65_00390 [Nanoarchaeota archaeon]
MEDKYWDSRRRTWICPYDNKRMCYRSLRVGEAFDYTCKTCDFKYGDFSHGSFEGEAEKYLKKSRDRIQEKPKHIHLKKSDFRRTARQLS